MGGVSFQIYDQLKAENERLRTVLRYFVGCAYPVAKEINPRGYDWRSPDALDYALGEAKAVLNNEQAVVTEEK